MCGNATNASIIRIFDDESTPLSAVNTMVTAALNLSLVLAAKSGNADDTVQIALP